MQNQFFGEQNEARSSSIPQESGQLQAKHQNTMENSTNSDRSNQKFLISGSTGSNEQIQGQTNSKDQLEDSFEEDPLQEHKEVFQDVVSKNSSVFYLESKKRQEYQKSHSQNQATIFKEITLETFLTFLFERLRQVKPRLVDSFHSYLEKQKTFFRFLQHIYYSYPNRVAVPTLKYIFLVWELYSPYLKQKPSFNEAILISMRIAEKIYKSELNARLHREECSNELKTGLRCIIEAVAVTISLMMEGHGANPLFNSKEKSERQSLQSTLNASASDEHIQKMAKSESSAIIE